MKVRVTVRVRAKVRVRVGLSVRVVGVSWWPNFSGITPLTPLSP